MTVNEFFLGRVGAGHTIEITRHDLHNRLRGDDWHPSTTSTMETPRTGAMLGGDRRLRRITVQEDERITLNREATASGRPACRIDVTRRFLFMLP
jgi:hypothetical protein